MNTSPTGRGESSTWKGDGEMATVGQSPKRKRSIMRKNDSVHGFERGRPNRLCWGMRCTYDHLTIYAFRPSLLMVTRETIYSICLVKQNQTTPSKPSEPTRQPDDLKVSS